MKKIWVFMVLSVLAFVTSVQASEYRHRLSAFTGFVDSVQNNENDFAFGGEYEYRPFKHVGCGFGYERSDKAIHTQGANKLFGTVTVHPIWGLRLSGSIGEVAVGHFWNGSDSTLKRYTVGYDFTINNLVMSPVWSMDRINQDDVQSYGVQVGVTFN